MKLLFLTGSRSEWGYIRPILKLCEKRGIDYHICATNMLLLPAYGTLIDEIRRDGYTVSDELYMALEGHNHYTMSKSLGVFLSSFTDTLNRLRPTWVVLSGDRAEQLMGAVAAAYTYTPVAHIQAGERSGNIDGVSRHAIGKLVHLHFAANEDAATRLRNLGEEAFRIHNVGAPQLDEIVDGGFPDRQALSRKYGLDLARPYLLMVQHPVTEEMDSAYDQAMTLGQAVEDLDVQKVWVLPNNDAGAGAVRRALFKFRSGDTQMFDNLPRADYLGFLTGAAAIVGNSSSGILEAPTLKIAAVNVGRRQLDRVRGTNVIDVPVEREAIRDGVRRALSEDFQAKLEACVNPYGDGKSSSRIIDCLANTPIDDRLLIKRLTL
jgi:GDP/UDP-N,N'-diacetylbacillosamine 2-epimerase (hydrolysing)